MSTNSEREEMMQSVSTPLNAYMSEFRAEGVPESDTWYKIKFDPKHTKVCFSTKLFCPKLREEILTRNGKKKYKILFIEEKPGEVDVVVENHQLFPYGSAIIYMVLGQAIKKYRDHKQRKK